MKKRIIGVIPLLMLSLMICQIVQAQTPFSISVDPITDTAFPAELKEYTITINANPGFTDSGYLELEISALSYNEMYNIGVFEPPYPAVIVYEFPVPEDVPGDVTAYGTITAFSGDFEAETEVTLMIKSGGILGSIIGWFLSMLNTIRNLFS